VRLVVIASAAKQSILSYCGKMDCFAALAMTARAMDCFAGPVIGRIARRGCERAFSRLCERSEAIHSFFARQDGLLRFARNDGGGCFMPPLTGGTCPPSLNERRGTDKAIQ